MSSFEKQCDVDMKLVKEHVEQLMIKFDTVQIFVTRYDVTTQNTITHQWGAGNYCARTGQVDEWLVRQRETMKIAARKEEEKQ